MHCHAKKLGLNADSIRSLASKFHLLRQYAQTNRLLCKFSKNKAEYDNKECAKHFNRLQQKCWMEMIYKYIQCIPLKNSLNTNSCLIRIVAKFPVFLPYIKFEGKTCLIRIGIRTPGRFQNYSRRQKKTTILLRSY